MTDDPTRTGRPSRHAWLDGDEPSAAATPASCPCCGETLVATGPDDLSCPQCGYPRNSAAWVEYDGCC